MYKLSEIVSFFQYGDLPTSYFVKRGMKVGKNFNRQSGTRIDPSHCWLISIGDDVCLANKVQILAHDDTIRIYSGYSRVGEVTIGDRVFVGANSTILMNTHIGSDVIIGAGSLVTKDIPDNSIVCGIPARIVGKTSDYVAREKSKFSYSPLFDSSYSYYSGVGMEKKNEMREKISESSKVGYLDIGYYRNDKK